MSDEILSVSHLQCWLTIKTGYVRAVDDVSFKLYRGKTLAILGESGCGKSMTALALLRLLPDYAKYHRHSEVLYQGVNLIQQSEASLRSIRGKKIAMIFQEPGAALNPVLTIGQQVIEAMPDAKQMTRAKRREQACECLTAVGIPDAALRLDQYPHQLSGGLKQRVVIATALAAEPDIIIADEPTTALDVTIQAQILKLLKKLQKEKGLSVLLITHDLGVVAENADDVAVMYAGHFVEQAAIEDFIRKPQHPYSQSLLAALPDHQKRHQLLQAIPGSVPNLTVKQVNCRFLPRCQLASKTCQSQQPAWETVMKHHQVRCHHPGQTRSHSEPVVTASSDNDSGYVLQAKDLKIYYPIKKGLLKRTVGYVKAVDGIDLNVRSGKTLAIVGESGCGKTTLGKGLLGLLPWHSGAINTHKGDLLEMPKRARSKFIQVVFQDPYASLNPKLSVFDILSEALDLTNAYRTPYERKGRLLELLAQVGLREDHLLRYPHEFSGGQRQRIAIARALATEPEVLICDEPTSALDVSVQAQILNLLKSLQQELQLSLIFITHDISVVAYMADEIAVMYLGRVVEQGFTNDILNQAQHPYTQALLKAVPKLRVLDNDKPQQPFKHIKADEMPSAIRPPSGCHYHPRCCQRISDCSSQYPQSVVVNNQHMVKCLLVKDELNR